MIYKFIKYDYLRVISNIVFFSVLIILFVEIWGINTSILTKSILTLIFIWWLGFIIRDFILSYTRFKSYEEKKR